MTHIIFIFIMVIFSFPSLALEGNELMYKKVPRLREFSGNVQEGDLIPVYDATDKHVKRADAVFFIGDLNTINVREASDITGEIECGKLYRIIGTVDLGDQSITVPTCGLSMSGANGARDISVLTSSEDNYSMLVTEGGSYSGNIIMDNMTLNVTGSNSQIFDLDNDGNLSAIDMATVNFGAGFSSKATSLGQITDYRQLFGVNIGFFIEDGLTFNGDFTGIAIRDSIVLGFPASAVFLKEGASFTTDNVRTNINFSSVDATSVLTDFDEDNIVNDAGFDISDVITTATNPIPNLPSSSVKARISNSIGIRDTYVGGQWVVTSEAETTISAVDTPVKVAGTTTYSDLQWFTGDNNNEFVFISDQEVESEIKAVLSITGGSNDQINIILRQWDNSASSYINLSESGTFTLNAGGRAEGVAAFAYAILNENDRIELWVENQSDADNVTILNGGLVSVVER